jgi:pimeloyl-ACP methyl ester carboxylesterase
MTYTALPEAPTWFTRALAVPRGDLMVDVAGCPIHALTFGRPGTRGLVFVHGGGAHAHWWTHVAASFAEEFRVVCVDLSGHGDSGHRSTYSLEQWTDEVMAVASAGDIAGPPVVVGHSMGGFVTIGTAARHGDAVSGAIVCDSPVTEPDPEIASYRLKEAFGRPRVYPTMQDALYRRRTTTSTTSWTTSPTTRSGRPTVGSSGNSTGTFSPSSAGACAVWPSPTCPGYGVGSLCCAPSTAWSPRISADSCTRSWVGSPR